MLDRGSLRIARLKRGERDIKREVSRLQRVGVSLEDHWSEDSEFWFSKLITLLWTSPAQLVSLLISEV